MLSTFYKLETELQSACNRFCEWCPNSFIDRAASIEFPEDKFLDMLQQLKEGDFGADHPKDIGDYTGLINLARYSETFLNPDLLKLRGEQVKKILPDVKLTVNTNGDYLQYLNLKDYKVDEYNISDYDNRGLDAAFEYMESLGCTDLYTSGPIVKGWLGDIFIRYRSSWAENILLEDRAGAITKDIYCTDTYGRQRLLEFKEQRGLRQWNCVQPRDALVIDYNGNMMPCCHYRSDYVPHQPFIFGNIFEQRIEDILKSDKYIKFADDVEASIYPEPCMRCAKRH